MVDIRKVIGNYRYALNSLASEYFGDMHELKKREIFEAYSTFRLLFEKLPQELRDSPECQKIENDLKNLKIGFFRKFGYRRAVRRIQENSSVLLARFENFLDNSDIERDKRLIKNLKKRLTEKENEIKRLWKKIKSIKNDYETRFRELSERDSFIPAELNILLELYQVDSFLWGVRKKGLSGALISLKEVGEDIESEGDPEGYGSTILKVYRMLAMGELSDLSADITLDELVKLKPKYAQLENMLKILLKGAIHHYETQVEKMKIIPQIRTES